MSDINTYASWGGYAISYDMSERTFSVKCPDKNDAIYKMQVEGIEYDGKNIGGLESLGKCDCARARSKSGESVYLSVKYSKGSCGVKSLLLKFIVSDEGIKVRIHAPEKCRLHFTGYLSWGDGSCENTYPMSTFLKDGLVRSAVGPASSNRDNLLFDRLNDTALGIEGGKSVRIKYDWEQKCYVFSAWTGLSMREKTILIYEKKKVVSESYHIDYKPMSRDRIFTAPPVGWMTWYAVKFDACEEKVLKNAKFQSEHLKDYGANCVWVDWEWYHKDMTGSRNDGADTFTPDKEKYPNGLKYVADQIKEMGLVPALWIGFTNDPAENEYIKENPEIILADDPTWCGRYFLDFSHPKYLNEFLPKALECVPNWGYEAVKYDTLPIAMIRHEQYHSRMYDSSLTTYEAYRGMIEKTRNLLGEKCYMLSCAASNDADVLWGAGVFDAARIGGDIFKWEEFLVQGVERTLRYYPLHNHVLYADCDNVVIREEYNNYVQSASRMYFVSMLGLPMTFGDEFDVLSEDRIDLIKSCLPILDIHPMDTYRQSKLGTVLKMNLAIEKEWESYNVVNVFNTGTESIRMEMDLQEELGLDEGEYLIYDYTKDAFWGVNSGVLEDSLDGCESRIYCIRKKIDRPQIISTSRHISQGAAEIKAMDWSEEKKQLTIHAELIGNVAYTATLYVPEGFAPDASLECVGEQVYKKTIVPAESGATEITIRFS